MKEQRKEYDENTIYKIIKGLIKACIITTRFNLLIDMLQNQNIVIALIYLTFETLL